jgi:LuxR family maltose regulon positive regulatory protein
MLVKTPTVPTPPRPRPQPGGADRVLQAKIMAPGVPGWMVPRPRLDKRIEEGTAGPLTVVTGPPGAGKTMAVASWAAARPGPVAWVTLDHYDSRPKVFWATIVEALRDAGVTLKRVSAAPARTATSDHVFLLRLASELAVQDPPVVLVLDDLHLLTGTGLMDGLEYLLRNARSGLRMVVCSRTDPMLPLHRYRLAGELTEIRASELAFSVPEAGLLMAQHGITLPPKTLELLTKLDEGWAAGLRLAAISLDEHPDPGQFIKGLAAENSAITGYLIEEALNNQPAQIRDLLLSTSILDRVNSGIAGELTGNEQAAGTLAALARANAFVQPLGNGWYRYHSLFAEVLRLKLRLERPGQLPDLHRRAARWYQANGLLLDAVRQAVAAGDWPLAAQLVLDELAIGQLVEPHARNPLADCFRPMPNHLTWTQPQPALIAAALALADVPVADCTALDVAEGILERLGADTETPSRLAAAMLRLAVARRTGDLAAAAASMARVEKLIEKLPADILARHADIDATVLSARGVVQLWSGDLDEAAASLDAGAAAAALSRSMPERTDCLGYLALLEALRGRLNRAAELAAEAAGLAREHGPGLAGPACGAAEVALALVHLERNELHDARDRLKRADAALRVRPEKLVGATACLVVARYRLAEGRAKAASEMIARARHGWSPPGWLDHRLTMLESRAYAVAGDVSSAVAIAVRANPRASLEATTALAHAWLDAGDPTAAGQALENGPDDADEAQDNSRLDRWLVDARLGYSRGEAARVRRSLHRALGLAESEQFRLPFAMQAAWIRPVLRSDPHLADAHWHLLEPDLIGPGRDRAGPSGTGQATAVIVEQLSGREREVLSLLSGMLSTAEVASELYISVNTVKTHLKSIYRKLAATHRGEAVRRARQLELL